MALKLNITKEEFDKLPKDIQTEYAADGDGYKLDVAGIEDTGALRRAKDREAQQRREAEKALKEAQDELDRVNGDDARKNGDIATLEKSWQKKLDDANAESTKKIESYKSHIQETLVDSVAMQLASEISTAPAVILPHIKNRLQADFDGDKPATVILDATGTRSTMDIKALKDEFVANKDFSAIIKAGSGNGGGAAKNPKDNNSGAANIPSTDNNGGGTTDLTKLDTGDLVALLKAQKEQGD